MKSLLDFAMRIMSVRLAVISVSLAQTTLWATVLGLDGFGVTAAFISAQSLASLLGRFGSDNLIVRHYKDDPNFAARFPGMLLAITGLSILTAGFLLIVLTIVVFRKFMGGESLILLPIVMSVNLSVVQSRILLAQKRAVTASFLGGFLPNAVSVGMFASMIPVLDSLTLSGPMVAIGLLGLGHLIAAMVMAAFLGSFWRDCLVMIRTNPQRLNLLSSSEQWYFLGYQSIGLLRGASMPLAVAALFGPSTTGVFALAYRFGSLLLYFNEPARMYVTPRIVGKTIDHIISLYRKMLGLNAGLGILGITILTCAYNLVTLPFPTDPPFLLYTLIIMGAATFNLFVGPVGIILAMSGNEKNNFFANLWGLIVVIAFTLLAAITQSAVFAVIGVSSASIIINLINVNKILIIKKNAQ